MATHFPDLCLPSFLPQRRGSSRVQLRTPFLTSQLWPLPFLHCQLLSLYWCWCRVSRRAHTEHRGKHCPSAVKTDWPSEVVTTPSPQLQRCLLLLSVTRAAETLSRRISCLIRAVGNLRLIDRLLRDYGPYLTFLVLGLPPPLCPQSYLSRFAVHACCKSIFHTTVMKY